MATSSTATQRTYRYLRLSIVGAVLALFVSLIVVASQVGALPPSISAMLYTPGRTVFVGVLFAVAVAFLALSGHSVAQALIDIAAVFAVLIVIIPTPVASGEVPDVEVVCPEGAIRCVPESEWANIANGMLTFAVFGLIAVAGVLALAALQQTLSAGVWVTAAAASLVILGATGWWALARTSFLDVGHFVVTTCFFALIAVVSGLAARGAGRGYRFGYAAIAIGIAIDLTVLLIAAVTRAPVVLAGEVTGLLLFAAFWILQTAENWTDSDPAITR
ncbi:hypothetical protein [Microbacterium sp. P01]|uniref:hypothetical protein n=1 Tax=unclassified Microbacterium TaxID=2609290 RepID=UPI00366F77AC